MEKSLKKGELIFTEFGPSKYYLILFVTLMLTLLFFISFLLFRHFEYSEPVVGRSATIRAIFFSLLLTIGTAVLTFVFIALFSKPIKIYEKGFVGPTSILSFRGKRFVSFDEIREIRLLYISNQGLEEKSGVVITMKNGESVTINTLQDLEELIAITKALKRGLDDRWIRIYKKDPEIINVFGKEGMMDRDEVLKKAEEMTDEEFFEMKGRIEGKSAWVIALLGFCAVVIPILLVVVMGFSPLPYLLVPALGIILFILAMMSQNRTNRDLGFIKKLVEIEKEEGGKILPDDLHKIDDGIFHTVFVDEPKLSSKRWKRIAWSSRYFDLVNLLFLLLMLPIILMGSTLLFMVLPYSSILIWMIPLIFLAWVFYLIVVMCYTNLYRSVIEYQDLIGERVIPEDIDSKIYRGWKLKDIPLYD